MFLLRSGEWRLKKAENTNALWWTRMIAKHMKHHFIYLPRDLLIDYKEMKKK